MEKTRELKAEAGLEPKKRSLADNAPSDQGYRLLSEKGDNIVAWLQHLGLPCYPNHVSAVKKSKPPIDHIQQPSNRPLRSSTASPPAYRDGSPDSETDSESVVVDVANASSQGDAKYATARYAVNLINGSQSSTRC